MNTPDPTARLAAALADRYRIERELGQGGMATVCLAADLKHDRKVAIKVLKPELAAVLGAERFVAEIRTTAKLQHPHILPLLDSGSVDGLLFYVMPFVAGESLRDRLEREKQLPIADAVRIALEVADALNAAHAQGVIHRDIKPENILLQGGHALVADFGIALAVQQAGSTRMTQTGMSLGTPQYMSPEQAMGEKLVDARTDLYALGAVTYEMLVGDPPFTGSTVQAIVAKLMTDPARPPSELRRSVPPHVEAAVLAALQKLPADRVGTAAEFAGMLAGTQAVRAPVSAAASRRRGNLLPWTVATLSVVAAVGLALRRPPPPEPVTLQFAPPSEIQLWTQNRRADFALSPDGTTLVFTGISQEGGARQAGLFARRMSDGVITPLRGGEGGFSPFFSPDGRSIGFHRTSQIFRMPAEGGVAVSLPLGEPPFISGAWAPDGRIIYTSGDYTLKAFVRAGEEPVVLSPALPTDRRGPWLAVPLPDDRGVLYRHCSTTLAPSCVLAVVRGDGTIRELGITALQGWYLPTGHLVYVRQDGTVLGVPFDLAGLRITGEPVPLLEGVSITPDDAPHLAWSPAGTLAYVAGDQFESSSLELVDASGSSLPITSRTGMFRSPVPSPDGHAIALRISPPGAGRAFHLWVVDRETGTPRPLLTDRHVLAASWSPDGQELAVVADSTRGVAMFQLRLYRVQATGGDSVRNVLLPEGMSLAGSSLDWSPDGRWLVAVRETAGGSDLVAIAADGSGEWHLLAGSPARESGGRISPDGTRLAYVSDESGEAELYVRPFLRPGAGVALGIRVGGGSPRWRPDGRALMVQESDSVTVLELAPGPAPRLAARRTLPAVTAAVQGSAQFAPDPAGAGVIVVRPVVKPAALTVVLNWFTEVRRRIAEAPR